jgi:hypothetical protein
MRAYLFIFSLQVFCGFLVSGKAEAQEINAKVTVISAQIGNIVDKRVFQNLQTSLVSFINKRKWTNDVYIKAL